MSIKFQSTVTAALLIVTQALTPNAVAHSHGSISALSTSLHTRLEGSNGGTNEIAAQSTEGPDTVRFRENDDETRISACSQSIEKDLQDKRSSFVDSEKTQLVEIWDATVCRNTDIKFVIQKLIPTKDPRHSPEALIRILCTAMLGTTRSVAGVGDLEAETGYSMKQSVGGSLVRSCLFGSHSQGSKSVTEAETIMIYNTLKNVLNNVSLVFHEYKKDLKAASIARTTLVDLQKQVTDAGAVKDSQIEREFLIRKARREIDGIDEDKRQARASLVSLAGAEAVDNLDKQIASENINLNSPAAR